MKTLIVFAALGIVVFVCTIALVVIGQEVSVLLACLLAGLLLYTAIRYGIGHLTRL